MAKRTKDKKEGYGKLLDAWVPPKNAGMPIGCVATSFTFSSSFFEEECLSRFLSLETDPTEDGPLYLIEREEKLSQVISACAVVDQHHCKGPRSLRWDLLPARVPAGILHAKISLLVWSDMVRLIVASANLTEDGYRRNLEVFGTFDYRQGGECPILLLQEVVDFLGTCAGRSQPTPEAPSPALARVNALLDKARAIPSDWGLSHEGALRNGVVAYPVLVGPDRQHALETLAQLWPGTNPPHEAHVVSPFFDPPDAPNLPVMEIWQRLRKRGNASVSFYVDAEDIPDDQVLVHAPKSLFTAQPTGRPGVETHAQRVELEATRPLHAKGISFKNQRWMLYMIGSSNFTSAGLGLGSARNLEANVAYLVDTNRQPKTAEAFNHAFPASTALNMETLKWQSALECEDEIPSEEAPLPETFGSATYTLDDVLGACVVFEFAGYPPAGWTVVSEHEDSEILSQRAWADAGQPATMTVEWKPSRPPSGFWVSWSDVRQRAWWPVNVESMRALPPPDELKSLSLEILIEILTSARPLHRVLGEYLKRKKDKDKLPLPVIIDDPHKRVDTSRFLLQRTRRVSWALSAIRDRMERPVATEEGLHWRFYGPVGVHALVEALLKEGQSQQEKVFFLSELALTLLRVKPQTAPGYLPAERTKAAIGEMIQELREETDFDFDGVAANLKAYVREVFESAGK